MASIPLSLYVHIPWCERKCPYCDFNSHEHRAQSSMAEQESNYVRALLCDLDEELSIHPELSKRSLTSIFIGGGTPSLFAASSFAFLIQEIQKRLPFDAQIEVTLEANPGSSEVTKFAGFRQAGINRLSIGVQSFSDPHLTALGRIHSGKQAIKAASAARSAGFDNFNLDLMFGLPEQTTEQAIADLEQAIQLRSSHLSFYQLTIEPNTLFYSHPPITPEQEVLWEMQTQLQEKIRLSSFSQYEVSAYASEGRQCKHNRNYWEFGDYIGIGAGAHGKISKESGEVFRSWKIKHPQTYLDKQSKLGGRDSIEASSLRFEFMLNALRLRDGFDINLFEQRSLQDFSQIEALVQEQCDKGLLEVSDSRVRATEFGFNRLDDILQAYLP